MEFPNPRSITDFSVGTYRISMVETTREVHKPEVKYTKEWVLSSYDFLHLARQRAEAEADAFAEAHPKADRIDRVFEELIVNRRHPYETGNVYRRTSFAIAFIPQESV